MKKRQVYQRAPKIKSKVWQQMCKFHPIYVFNHCYYCFIFNDVCCRVTLLWVTSYGCEFVQLKLHCICNKGLINSWFTFVCVVEAFVTLHWKAKYKHMSPFHILLCLSNICCYIDILFSFSFWIEGVLFHSNPHTSFRSQMKSTPPGIPPEWLAFHSSKLWILGNKLGHFNWLACNLLTTLIMINSVGNYIVYYTWKTLHLV